MASHTAKTPARKATKADAPQMLEGIFVRSLAPSFRRAGFEFTREGFGLLLTGLSEQQLKAIEAEPLLSVTYCEIPATAEDDAQAADGAKEPASQEADA